jgi:hypothetical protein
MSNQQDNDVESTSNTDMGQFNSGSSNSNSGNAQGKGSNQGSNNSKNNNKGKSNSGKRGKSNAKGGGKSNTDSSKSGNLRNTKNYSEGYNSNSVSMFSTMNLSTPLVTTKHFNRNVVVQPYRVVKDQTIVIEYTVSLFKDRLESQAQVWARKILSSNQNHLRNILDSRKYEWLSILTKCYIYSYFTGALYALTDQRVAEIPKNRSMIAGHAIFYHVLMSPGFNFKQKGQTVVYRPMVSKSDYASLLNIAKSYEFIRDNLVDGTRFSLCNAELDRALSNLHNELGPQDPQFLYLDDSSKIGNYLNQDCFAISNSMYMKRKKVLYWYYCSNENCSVIDGSTLFGKALFITSIDDGKVQNFFDSNLGSDDELSFVKYEVSALAGSEYPDPIPGEAPPK